MSLLLIGLLRLSLSLICDRDGEVTHIVGIQYDVTARVTFGEALRESEKLATAGRLAASIAHEIDNPLEAVTNDYEFAPGDTDGVLSINNQETGPPRHIEPSILGGERTQAEGPSRLRPYDAATQIRHEE